MDYLTNYYRNKAEVLSEQIQKLQHELQLMEAPAQPSPKQPAQQEKLPGFDITGAIERGEARGSTQKDIDAANAANQGFGKGYNYSNTNSSSKTSTPGDPEVPVPTGPVTPAVPEKRKEVDTSNVYKGDDSWLKDATAPLTLPGSFAGDRTENQAETKDQPQNNKFDVVDATKNLLDQMNRKYGEPSNTPQKTPEQNAAQVRADSEARATRGMQPQETEDQESERLARQQAERERNAARVEADMEARDRRGMRPQDYTPPGSVNRATPGSPGVVRASTPEMRRQLEQDAMNPSGGESRSQQDRRLQAERERNAARVKADSEARATRGMGSGADVAPNSVPEKPGLIGELGNAFGNAGRALFNLPRDVGDTITRIKYGK